MPYTYKDIKDKSIEGIKKETTEGLAKIGFYFFTTYGIPLNVFRDILSERFHTMVDEVHLYFRFRNDHPELFQENDTP